MALGDVNEQTVTIASGAIALVTDATYYPTGSGIYRVETESGVADDLTSITGGTGFAMITLFPATDGEWFTLVHDGSTIFLSEETNFVSAHIRDHITLRLDGSVWVEESRVQYPPEV